MLTQVYQTNFEGVFVGFNYAQTDEVSGQLLLPAGSYQDAPPETASGQVAIRDGDVWRVVEDPRGKSYFLNGVEMFVDVVRFQMPEGGQWKEDYLKSLSIIEIYTKKIMERLDTFARTRGYDSIAVATTYANSSEQAWAYEGSRAIKLRDDTWRAFFQYSKDVDEGKKNRPEAFAQIEPFLPALTW